MFKCPLVKVCAFSHNDYLGATIYNETVDGKDCITIDCSKCEVLDNIKYQEIIKKMEDNERTVFDIFNYLNYFIQKEREG